VDRVEQAVEVLGLGHVGIQTGRDGREDGEADLLVLVGDADHQEPLEHRDHDRIRGRRVADG
jgi:hypothetical protein